MPRRPAIVTQADVRRVIRAARKEGASSVEIKADGTILVRIFDTHGMSTDGLLTLAPREEAVL